MKSRLRNGIALSIIPQIILVKWLGTYPDAIEKYYSNGIYPFISKFFRILFGWIPFSVGDIIYFILIFLALRYLLLNRKRIRYQPKAFLRNVVMVLSVAYFTFHLLWGLNYYRQPIFQKMELAETHTNQELLSFVNRLIIKTNTIQFKITADSTKAVKIPYTQKEIFEKTLQGYKNLENQFPFLGYERPSIKKSLFSTVLSYMGYGGYLNPFTLEGQVNAKLPKYRFPVVSGHEIGHQLGYSAEDETNLIGYMVTANNKDIYFKYAAYSYALRYCLADIQRRDEAVFNELYAKLNVGIKENYKEMSSFWMAYENPMEPLFKSVFNTFLKANNQKEGIKSYNSVVSLLVTYHEKHPL
ncbi:MAG: DUF3810 domain-containing protein [Flavobacteriaceae bacterium]